MKQSEEMQRWLAVGLLVSVIALVFGLTVIPVASKLIELGSEEENLALKLKKYERILSRKNTVTASVEALNEKTRDQGYFNSEQTGALASAEMQEFIKKAIVDAGGKLSSTQALPVKNKDNFSLLTVSVRMTGNIEVLRSVLYQLETSTPLIIIDQLDIRPMRGVRNRVTRQIEPSNDLNINFQAVSFMRSQAAG